MVLGDTAQRVANLKPDPSADAGIHFVEHQRRNVVRSRENGFECKHHARQLAARGNARQRPAVVASVERDSKLHVLHAALVALGLRLKSSGKLSTWHPEFGKQRVDGLRQLFRGSDAQRAQPRRLRSDLRAGGGFPRSKLRNVKARGIDQIELCPRFSSHLEYVVKRRSVFLDEVVEHAPPASQRREPVRIQIDRSGIIRHRSRQLIQRVEAGVEQLLEPGCRWIDSLNGAEQFVHRSQPLERTFLIRQCCGHRYGDRPQLVRVLEDVRFFLELHVLAGEWLCVLDLAHNMSQIIGVLLSLGLSRCERRNFAAYRRQLRVRRAHDIRLWCGTSEFVEDAPLRLAVEQRLSFVLAVKIHERAPDFAENRSGDGRSVRPRASPPCR